MDKTTQSSGRRRQHRQDGFMLLEVLIAILIFAFGVLAVVGLQASAARNSAQAKYRADATMLVDDLIGRMWSSNRSTAALQAAFSCDAASASYAAWLAQAQSILPGIDLGTCPVSISPAPSGEASSLVSITLKWRAPNDPASVPLHQVVITTQIS